MDLLHLQMLQNVSLLPGAYLRHCIEQLNALHTMKLNAYIDFGNPMARTLPDTQAAVPTLWITHVEPQLMLVGHHSERALTIVYMDEQPHIENATLHYLTKWLWRLPHLNVLVVYRSVTEQQLFRLFMHCWRQGMVHILAVLPHTNELYSYMPYPTVSLLRFYEIQQYFDRTRGMLWNFHHYSISVGVLHNAAPRAFVFEIPQKRKIYAGYMLQMVIEFIEHYNGSVRIVKVNSRADSVQALIDRTIDFQPTIVHPSSTYSGSITLWHESNYVIAPMAQPLPRHLYVLRPYSFYTWLAWLAMLAYCSVALYVLERGSLNVSGAFLQILCHALYLPKAGRLVNTPRTLIVWLIMIVSGFMLTNLYQALLSSMQAAGLYGHQLNTYDDLAGTSYQMLQFIDDYKIKQGLPDLHPQLAQRMIVVSEIMVDEYRRQLNTSYLHGGFEDRIDLTLYQQKFLRVPLFRKMPVPIYQQPMYIPASHGRAYLQLFNWFIRRMFEGGIVMKMKLDCFDYGIQSGVIRFIEPRSEVVSNSLQFYYIVVGLWAGGLLLATMCFAVELYVGRMKRSMPNVQSIKTSYLA